MIPKSHIRLGKPDGLTSDDIYATLKDTTTDVIKQKCDANASLPVINVKSILPYLPYLDIKTKSDGHGLVHEDYVIYKEHDGSIVGLRPGTDGTKTRYYYFYSRDIDAFLSGDFVISDQEYGIEVVGIRGKSRSGFAAITTTNKCWIVSNKGSYDPSKVKQIDVSNFITSGYWIVDDNKLFNIALNGTEFGITITDLSTSTSIYTGRIFDPLNPLDIHYLPDNNSLVAEVTHTIIVDFLHIDNYFVLVCMWDVKYSNGIWHRIIGFITFQYKNGTIDFTYPKTYLYDPNSDKDYYPIFKNVKFDWYRYESISLSIIDNIPIVFRSAYNHAYFTYSRIKDFDITKLGDYLVSATKTVNVIPVDLCPIGKRIFTGVYIDKDKLSILSSSYTSDHKWVNNYVTVFKDPYDAFIDPREFIGFCYDGVNNTSTFYQRNINDIIDKSGNVLDKLPDDWYDQCNNFIHNDPDFFVDRKLFDLLYITDNKYILVYPAVKGSTGYIKYCIVTNDGTGTLSFGTPEPYVLGSGARDVIECGGTRPFVGVYINSSNVYIALSPSFMLVKDHWTTYTSGSYYTGHLLAKLNPGTLTAVAKRVNPYKYLSGRMGVHELYGPYITFNELTYLVMNYVDNTTITDVNTRLTTCFDQFIAGTGTVKAKTIQTIQTPSSHYLYIRPSYGVYYTNNVKVKEERINLTQIATPPAIFYTYVKPVDRETVAIDVTTNLNFSRPLIGTITTSTTSVDSIQINNPVFVDSYRIYNETDPYNNQFVHSNVIVSSHHSDMGDAPQFFPTLLGTSFFTYNPPPEVDPLDVAVPGYMYRMAEGVVKLSEYASTVGTATIIVPNLSKIRLVVVNLCNCGDGFNHAYYDQNTYINVFAENITNNQFSIKCTSGATLDFDYVWVHWIAIGEE